MVDLAAPQTLTKTFSNKEIVVSKAPQKASTRYLEKPKEIWEFISPVEIEFLSENPWEIAKKMFSKDFFFIPRDLRKNKKFYEFVWLILIQLESNITGQKMIQPSSPILQSKFSKSSCPLHGEQTLINSKNFPNLLIQ